MAEHRLWPSTNGAGDVNYGSAVTIATEIYVTSDRWIKSFWFYRTSTAINPTAIRLYQVVSAATGTAVTDTGFTLTAFSGTGWKEIVLPQPVPLTANVRYQVAMFFPATSNCPVTAGYWTTGAGSTGLTNGPLVAPRNSAATGLYQGRFKFATSISYPTENNTAGDCRWIDLTVTDVNPAPTANAGADQSVWDSTTVNLSGSGTDPQGGALTYAWTVVNAGGTGLTDANIVNRLTANASFTAPDVSANAVITLRLTVTDPGGLTGTDDVVVTVKPPVQASASFRIGYNLSAALLQIKALGALLSYGFNLVTSMRVAAPLGATLRVGFNLTGPLQVVWYDGSAQPYTYGHNFTADLTVGEPAPGLNIVRPVREYVPAARRGLRFIVQDILTHEFLEWDLPVSNVTIKFPLSGSKTITGQIDPEYPRVAELGMKSRGTWVHAEQEGRILASGILQPGSIEDETLSIDAAGFASYPHLVPYRSVYQGVQVDPMDIVRHIWGHVQSYPSGNLSVLVDPTVTDVRIGTPAENVNFETNTSENVAFTAGPYVLNWWTATNCGGEIDKLVKECPADYREVDYWNPGKTDVLHRLQLGYPRLGRKLTELAFTPANIMALVPLSEDPEMGVSEVIYTGAGEGSSMVQGSYIGQPDGRLRYPIVIQDTEITRTERARAFAEAEYLRRQATVGIGSLVIDGNHENAKLGTFEAGDDILVQCEVSYIGRIAMWHRIVSWEYDPESGFPTLELQRSDTFRYGRVAYT